MKLSKTSIIFIVAALLCIATGFFIGKGIYDRPLEESVTRDTMWLHDTVPDIAPVPKDSLQIKWLTRWLPLVRHDTTEQLVEVMEWLHDTVAVEVPITSKHYNGKNYDAYVSGFEPSLDSIFVYNETMVVTETIVKSKPPNKWEMNVVAGIDYNTSLKDYTPYAVGELMYKPSRLQLGVQGGVIRNGDRTEPIIGGKIRFSLF